MQLARKILFFIFILIYLVLCPLVILYSFGYILNPDKKGVSQTGVIYLSSIPSGADVYLEKSRFKHKTPTSIRALNPGKYSVTVKLNGYRRWSQKVNIKAGKAVTFDNILLLPKKNIPQDISSGEDYSDLVPCKGANYFILKKSSRLKDFYIYDQKNQEVEPIIQGKNGYEDFAVNSIYNQKQSRIFIAFGGVLWDKKYFLIDTKDKNQALIEITDLFPKHPDSILWRGKNKENIFALYDNYVNRLNAENLSFYPKYIDQIKGFGISKKELYILREDNTILKSKLNKKGENIVFKDKYLGRDLFKRSPFYRIRQLENDIFLFQGDRGDLITTVPPYHLVKKNLSDFNYNQLKKKLLFWTKDTIKVADFSVKGKKKLFKDQVQLFKPYSQGSNITQCFWVYQGTHLLFKDKDDVFLLRADPKRKYRKQHLVQVKRNTKVFYSEDTGFLYYINQEDQAMKIRIVPNKSFFRNFTEENDN
ncbi:MAG: PEGA domain-containing protein [Candidatus Omnitrophota bacterium]